MIVQLLRLIEAFQLLVELMRQKMWRIIGLNRFIQDSTDLKVELQLTSPPSLRLNVQLSFCSPILLAAFISCKLKLYNPSITKWLNRTCAIALRKGTRKYSTSSSEKDKHYVVETSWCTLIMTKWWKKNRSLFIEKILVFFLQSQNVMWSGTFPLK